MAWAKGSAAQNRSIQARLLLAFSKENRSMTTVVFSTNGPYVLIAGHRAYICDVNTGNVNITFSEISVNTAAFSTDSRRVIVATGLGRLVVFDASTGLPLIRLIGHVSGVDDAAFSPDGRRIVSGGSDSACRIWDASSGQQLSVLTVSGERVYGVAYSPNGARIVTASGSTARVWDAETFELLTTLSPNERFLFNDRYSMQYVTSAAFSPDSLRVVTASGANAKIWDARSGNLLRTLSGHTSAVSSAKFSPRGGLVLTASLDQSAKLWDANTGRLLATLAGHGNAVMDASFSPDGDFVATASLDSHIRIWSIGSRS
jgi:WD40 repeat protein